MKQELAVNSGGFAKQSKECIVLENLTPVLGAGCSSAVLLLLGLKGREWWWLVLQRVVGRNISSLSLDSKYKGLFWSCFNFRITDRSLRE